MAIKIDGKLETAAADGILADAEQIAVEEEVVNGKVTIKKLPVKLKELNDYVDERFNGANKTAVFDDYEAMVEAFKEADEDVYSKGQNIMIIQLNVPDLWISGVSPTYINYSYVDDDNIIASIEANALQIGYYSLSFLEYQKIDLGKYVSMYSERLSDGSYSLKLVKEV